MAFKQLEFVFKALRVELLITSEKLQKHCESEELVV